MNKQKPKIVRINDKMFLCPVTIVANCTREYFEKYLKDIFWVEHKTHWDAYFLSVEQKNWSKVITHQYIWVDKVSTDIYDILLLSHELMHHTFFAMRNVWITLSGDSEETFTYYFQHMFLEAYIKLLWIKK